MGNEAYVVDEQLEFMVNKESQSKPTQDMAANE